MINYQDGRIYRLVCDATGKQYIGSTIQSLHKRVWAHRGSYNKWKTTGKDYCTAYELFESGEVEIFLVEDYPCERKEQLQARERYWIETLECVNKVIPTRTRQEYLEVHKQEIKDWTTAYYHEHRGEILQRARDYGQTNKEHISQRMKSYYQSKREEILEQKKVRVECECGATSTKNMLVRHKRSQAHQRWEQAQQK